MQDSERFKLASAAPKAPAVNVNGSARSQVDTFGDQSNEAIHHSLYCETLNDAPVTLANDDQKEKISPRIEGK